MTARILVLDSLAARRRQLTEHILQPAGYATSEADRTNTAVSLTFECDLILVYHQPLDAFGFFSALHRANVDKPVILVTDSGSETLAIRCFRAGFGDYISAPFDHEDELLTSIERVLEKQIERNIYAQMPEQLLSANVELTTYLQGIDRVIEIGKTITSNVTLEAILSNVVNAAATITQSDTASILLLDDERENLYVQASHNLDIQTANDMRLPLNESLAGKVIHTGKSVFLNVDERQKIKTAYLVKSLAYLPLNISGQVEGVLAVDNRFTNRKFLSWQIQLLTLLSEFASIALSNANRYDQLKEVDHLKTNFIANISHDLRSPLTAIIGYTDLLSRAGTVNDQQKLFINRITMSAQSISSLITDLLDLSRIETSSHEIGLEAISMSLIVQYALAAVEGQIRAKQHHIVTHVDPQIPKVLGNGQRLKQMVRNLVHNAILYTQEGGTITLTLRAESGMIVLHVQDNGIGIPVEAQSRIFEKFYRADSVRETYEGAGLGLAIVKSIVDRHDGRIWVESHLGIGSVFTVLLPACPDKDTLHSAFLATANA